MKCPQCKKDNKPYWVHHLVVKYYQCSCGNHYTNKDRAKQNGKGTNLNDEGK